MLPFTPGLLHLLDRPDFWEVYLPATGGQTWRHAGERITPGAHVLTEREVRTRGLLAAQPEALHLSR